MKKSFITTSQGKIVFERSDVSGVWFSDLNKSGRHWFEAQNTGRHWYGLECKVSKSGKYMTGEKSVTIINRVTAKTLTECISKL